MHTLVLGTLVAMVTLAGKGGGKGAGSACPFVAEADLDKEGNVQNVIGLDVKKGGTATAFDVDGQVAKLRVNGSGELTLSGGVPAKLKDTAFVHVLLVDGNYKVHVAQPAKDLPEGIFSDAVQILLADGSGPKVALVSIPGSSEAEACEEIHVKTKAKWQRCWTNCKGG